MMMDLIRKPQKVLLALFVGLALTACGGGSGSGDGQGTLTTSLTDASTDEYQAVYVTVARVDVHLGGDLNQEGLWETVAEPNGTYNLLELVNGVREELGQAPLDAGHYTQMRLIIGGTPDDGVNLLGEAHPFANYVIDQDDNEIHELKVPSGPQTGWKIVNGFDILENRDTELLLDFDAMRSVVKAGASGQYLLKPTVKVLKTVNNAVVNGTVTEAPPATEAPTAPVPLAGAMITAQTVAPDATDPKDQVKIATGSLADDLGGYTLYLTPGAYNLVAVMHGYLPACTAVNLEADSQSTVDFALTADETNPGSVSFTVILPDTSDDSNATVDFRQEITCENALATTRVTVKSFNVIAGEYIEELPVGSYQVVVSSAGLATQTADVEVTSEVTTEALEFNLTANNP